MKTVNIPCTSARYMEFPDLLCGKSPEGELYFDATAYLAKYGKTVQEFMTGFSYHIAGIAKYYRMPQDELFRVNTRDKHILADETLGVSLLAFVDPEFWGYMLERMSEMLTNGIVLSDTSLFNMISTRFEPKQLKEWIDKNH